MERAPQENQPDPRGDDPRTAQRVDPKSGMSDDPRVEPWGENDPRA